MTTIKIKPLNDLQHGIWEHEENEEDSVKSVTLRAGVQVSDAHLKAATWAPCESPPCPSAAASQSPRWSSGSLSPPLKHSIQPSLKVTRLLSNDHSAVKMSQALIKDRKKRKRKLRRVKKILLCPLLHFTTSDAKRHRASSKLRLWLPQKQKSLLLKYKVLDFRGKSKTLSLFYLSIEVYNKVHHELFLLDKVLQLYSTWTTLQLYPDESGGRGTGYK